MAIIYHVSIEASEKENIFHIKWTDQKNVVHSFEQSVSDIAPEEVEWMWKDRRNQLRIGKKLFHFLDGKDNHLQQALKEAENHAESLQLHLSTCRETSNWPFELLAQGSAFLLPHCLHLVRSVSTRGTIQELPPQNRPLKLLFMACSPLDIQSELDFEKEEEAIFKITKNLAIDMEVEDTGSLEALREKLKHQQFDILHLSSRAGIDKNRQPFFVMENETGYQVDVTADTLWNEVLIKNPPKLLFISGDSTGEAPKGMENSIAYRLVENFGVQTVLGWGRSVCDEEANEAAKLVYKDLSRGESIIDAVQRARYQLINCFPEVLTPAWPLLRLFSRSVSFNAIVEKEQKPQPTLRRMTHIYLRNSQMKVLSEGFVGRRRQLQQSLRVLKKEPGKVGLLMLGTGGLGKSCLAGKVSERFKGHTLITIHGRLNSITLKRALKDAFIVAQDDRGKKLLSLEQEMKETLVDLCMSCFKDDDYLILLDDFEQNLEGSEKGEPDRLLPEAAELLKVLLHYLPDTGKTTQVIITSRYDFSLSVKGRNLVERRLERIWLTSFRESEQLKKARELKNISNHPEHPAGDKLLAAGCGNPRLMEWLNVLVGQMKASEVPELLKAINDKKEDFVREHVIKKLLQQGGDDLARFLCLFSIYRRPVLMEGIQKIGTKANLPKWETLLQRGMRLSLVEHDQVRKSFGVTPLLREELFKELAQNDIQPCHEAAFAYYKKNCEGKPVDQFDPILVEEWVYHALGCGEENVASLEGSKLVSYLNESLAFLESRRVGLWVLEKKKQKLLTEHDASLLNSLAYTIDELGDHREAIDYYQEALTIFKDIYGESHQAVAIMLNNLGSSWHSIGDYLKAIDYCQEGLTIWKDAFGEKHPQVATGLNNLGSAWQALGDHRKAIDYYQEALIINEAIFGRNHPNVARDLNNLGSAWQVLGDYRKAIDYFEQVLTIFKDFYGEKHPQVATGLNNLGSAWQALGDCRKAIDYYQEALIINESVFGQKHPNVARDLNNLGSAWQALGDYRKAIDYFEQVLTIFKDFYGEKHPQVATGMNNLGSVLQELGDYRKASAYYQEALTINEAIFGRKHPNVAIDLNNLGLVWHELDNHRKSIDYYQEALIIWKDVFGEKHPQVAIGLNSLGSAWNALGDHRKAIDYYREALTINELVFGREHPNTAIDLNNLGSAWQALGDCRKAIDYYQEALIINEAAFNREHPNVAKQLNNLGSAWDELGNHQKAIEYYHEALNIDTAAFGREHPNAATDLNNLGEAWRALGEPKKALTYFEQALTINVTIFGRKHPKVARNLNNLGSTWDELGNHRKAIDYLKQALTIDEAVFGREHPRIAIRFNSLGLAWDALGDHRKAIDYFEQALSIDETVFGREHPKVAIRLNNLGSAWLALRDHRKAIDYFEQALRINEAVFGQEHPKVAIRLNNLGVTYVALGEKEKAKAYFEKTYAIFNKCFGPEHPKTKAAAEWLEMLPA